MTAKMKERITKRVALYLEENRKATRQEILDAVLGQMGVSIQVMNDPSPGGKANMFRSYIGTVLTELCISGAVRRDGGCYILQKEVPIILRSIQCRAPILTYLKRGPATREKIVSAMESYFGIRLKTNLPDERTIRAAIDETLDELVRERSISTDGEVYALCTDFSSRSFQIVEDERQLKQDFLEKLRERGGGFLESFAANLLEKYYHLTGRDVLLCEVTGGSVDGGVDAVIETRDELGFYDTVMIQTKCRTSGFISEKEAREFFGAMTAKGATRGIYVTTTDFHAGAKQFMSSVPHLVGIGGEVLFELAKRTSYGIRKGKKGYMIDANIFAV